MNFLYEHIVCRFRIVWKRRFLILRDYLYILYCFWYKIMKIIPCLKLSTYLFFPFIFICYWVFLLWELLKSRWPKLVKLSTFFPFSNNYVKMHSINFFLKISKCSSYIAALRGACIISTSELFRRERKFWTKCPKSCYFFSSCFKVKETLHLYVFNYKSCTNNS